MKKLMTILVLFALCGVAMAAEKKVDTNKPVDLTMNTETTTTREYGPYWDGWMPAYGWHDVTTTEQVATTRDYLNVKKDGSLGTSGLTYTVTESNNGRTNQEAQVYFTTATSGPEGKKLAVQFLGAELETKDRSGNVYPGTVTDYGIYLYDPSTDKRTSDYLSATTYGNYFGEEQGITAGTSFGVYYVDGDGNYIASTGDGGKYYGETFKKKENGIVGNYDIDSHDLTVYDEVTNQPGTMTTNRHFLCLSSGEYGKDNFKFNHFEFMLQTTWDDPYYHVNPNDFLDEEHQVHIDDPVVHPNGQPLPGTLATLLIGGLCAKALSKKNKKH